MENWEEIFKGTIPVGKYKVSVKNGEELGLLIELESNEYLVSINFGAVSGLRMLDEGVILKELFEDSAISSFKNKNFSNTIYQVQNGEFDKFVKTISNELFEALNLKHYIVVTMNYVIETISQWDPSIEVIKK